MTIATPTNLTAEQLEDDAIERAEEIILEAWERAEVEPYQLIDGVASLAHQRNWGDEIVKLLEEAANQLRSQSTAGRKHCNCCKPNYPEK